MFYLIDGYNLIFSLIEPKESLKSLRQRLIQFLQKRFTQKKIAGIVIFDGSHRQDEESGLGYSSPLGIAYAPKGQSADAYIVEYLETAKYPKRIIVITNDKGLKRHAQSSGAKVQSNQEFLAWLDKKKKSSKEIEVKDTPQNIERLRQIFEERLKKGSEED